MAFRTSLPLRFGDCDPSGIAYFPSYLNHLVGVMEAFFGSLGFPWDDMIAKDHIGLPTVRLDLTFTHPGFHGDRLDFELAVRRVGRSSLDMQHRVSAAGTLLWSADHRIVATSTDTHKSIPWPTALRAALERHLETPDA